MSAITLTSANFKNEVLDYQGIVLVDFWAAWCGPCQMLAPIIEEISAEFADKVKIAKLDVDTESSLASQYNVTSIPTVVVFENGIIKQTIVGFHQKQEYVSALV